MRSGASMRESTIEKEVCEWARAHGMLPLKFTPMGEAGWPDRIFLYKNEVVFIEFKAPGKRARPLQEYRIKTLRVHEFTVGVYDDVNDAITFLETSLLSGAGRKDNAGAGMCRLTNGPGTGQDELYLHGVQDIDRQRLRQTGAGDLPAASGVSRVAPPKGQIR